MNHNGFRLITLALCSLLWISSSYAEDKPSERTGELKGDQYGQYRLSGALLFVNWDSFQLSLYPDPTTMTAGELFRKAHAFFQGSEFKGSINIQLPNGETFTVFDSKGNVEYFTFASLQYFSVEYTGPSAKEVTITCEITEEDVTSPDDTVCSGSKSYHARQLSASSFEKQGYSDMDTGDDIILFFLKFFCKRQGYHKLYNPSGASLMGEVIDELYEFSQKLPNVDVMDFITLLEDIGGIFLVGLTLEEIKEPSRPDDYKRVDDAWHITDPGLGGNELYGQLYMLPLAQTIKVCDLLKPYKIACPEKLKDLELPVIQGPAFPLFDYSRVQSSRIDFSISSNVKYPISAYYNNIKEHSYVIFSNLWETDGDGALFFDDCLAKGNALGFEVVDWSTGDKHRLSQCCFNCGPNIGILLNKEGEVIKDQESGLVEYQLAGVFDFVCDEDAGGAYEPYGSFRISIGKRSVNQNFKVWQAGAYEISLNLYSHYRQPFMIRFQESKGFMGDVNNKITLHGLVQEDDNIGDDVIGDYDGRAYKASELSELTTLIFRQDYADVVTIKLQVRPVIEDGEKPVLMDYVLSGSFSFSCDNDGLVQHYYEPYGWLSIDIGGRPHNQDQKVWQWDRKDTSSHELRCGTGYQQYIKINFKEVEDFMESGTTVNNKVMLHGRVLEADGIPASDDVIGDYDGTVINAHELAHPVTQEFRPDTEDRVIITLQITQKTSSTSKSNLLGRKIYSESEVELAHKLMAAIFPLTNEADKGLATDGRGGEL